MIRIGIAEDQALVRESLAVVLGLEPDATVGWTAATGAEAVQQATASPVDVLLMDLRLPDMDGVTAIRRIAPASHGTRVAILTTFPHDEWLLEALQAGAVACFSKEVPPRLLMDAIRRIVGDRWDPAQWSPDWRRYAPEIQFRVRTGPSSPAAGLGLAPSGETLTPREVELLRRLCAGATNGEIAANLSLSEGTVKNYVSQLYAKLGVRHRAEAIATARSRGLW